jgi:hypothetical protein
MKLSELKPILQFDTDFADNEIDATFYTEIEDILPKYAKQLNVVSISTNYIVCDFYDFIKHHKTAIREYLYKVYYSPWASYYFIGIFKDEDAECIAHFIEKDMDNFLRGDY